MSALDESSYKCILPNEWCSLHFEFNAMRGVFIDKTHLSEFDLFDVFIVEESTVALQYQKMAVEFITPDANNAVGIPAKYAVFHIPRKLIANISYRSQT